MRPRAFVCRPKCANKGAVAGSGRGSLKDAPSLAIVTSPGATSYVESKVNVAYGRGDRRPLMSKSENAPSLCQSGERVVGVQDRELCEFAHLRRCADWSVSPAPGATANFPSTRLETPYTNRLRRLMGPVNRTTANLLGDRLPAHRYNSLVVRSHVHLS